MSSQLTDGRIFSCVISHILSFDGVISRKSEFLGNDSLICSTIAPYMVSGFLERSMETIKFPSQTCYANMEPDGLERKLVLRARF